MRRARGRAVRRQGAEPAHAGPQLLAEAVGGRRDSTGSASVIDRVADVEYTLTDSVSEALLLEANLIKRYRPRFNVRLKDDKSYPYIKITLADDFPRVERTRKLPDDGSRYFGPYASASSVDEAMNLIRRLFPFRTCTIDIREGERALQRPCLLYHIKRCQGPCIEAIIDRTTTAADIAQVELFLEGRQEALATAAARARWQRRPRRTEYERAAALRDKVRAIERTMESQKMAAFARDRGGRPRPGPPGQPGGRPAVRRPRRQAGRARRLPARRPARAADDGGPGRLPAAVLRPRDDRSRAAVLVPCAARRRRRPRGVPRGPPRRPAVHLHVPQRGEKRELAGARGAQRGRDARPRAGALAGRPGQDARPRSRSWPRRWAARPAAAHRVLRHQQLPGRATSVGSMVVFEDGRPRTRRVPPLPDQDRRGPERLRQPPGGAAAPLPARRGRARRGARRSCAGRCRTSSSSTAARARSSAAQGGPRRAGLRRPAAGRPGQGARGALPARPRRAGRPARDVAGALPGPAAARRGAPVRDHLSPRPAREGGPSAPRSTSCPASGRSAEAGAAAGVRLGEARPRGAGRADRGGARHRRRRWRQRIKAALGERHASGGAPLGRAPRAASPTAGIASRLDASTSFLSSSSSSACSPSSSTSGPACSCPTSATPTAARGPSRPSSAWTSGRPPGRVPGAARRRQDADRRPTWTRSRTSSSAA